MADSEQALQDEMVFGPSTSFGVDKPIAPLRTGGEGGELPSSEYSLYFKMTLVSR